MNIKQQNYVLLFKFDKKNEKLIEMKSNLKLDLLNQIPDSFLIFTDGVYFIFIYSFSLHYLNI